MSLDGDFFQPANLILSLIPEVILNVIKPPKTMHLTHKIEYNEKVLPDEGLSDSDRDIPIKLSLL